MTKQRNTNHLANGYMCNCRTSLLRVISWKSIQHYTLHLYMGLYALYNKNINLLHICSFKWLPRLLILYQIYVLCFCFALSDWHTGLSFKPILLLPNPLSLAFLLLSNPVHDFTFVTIITVIHWNYYIFSDPSTPSPNCLCHLYHK